MLRSPAPNQNTAPPSNYNRQQVYSTPSPNRFTAPPPSNYNRQQIYSTPSPSPANTYATPLSNPYNTYPKQQSINYQQQQQPINYQQQQQPINYQQQQQPVNYQQQQQQPVTDQIYGDEQEINVLEDAPTFSTGVILLTVLNSLLVLSAVAAFIYTSIATSDKIEEGASSTFSQPDDNTIPFSSLEKGSKTGDVIKWEVESGWVSSQLPNGLLSNISLSSIDLSSSVTGQVVQSDGTAWIEKVISDIPASSFLKTGLDANVVPQYNGTSWVFQQFDNLDYSSLVDGSGINQYLYWNGSEWTTINASAIVVPASGITKGTANGQMLLWNGFTWTISIPDNIFNLNSLSVGTASNGDFLQYDGSAWVADTISNQPVSSLTNGSSTGDMLYFNGSSWVIGEPTGLIQHTTFSTSGATTGQVATSISANWTPSTLTFGSTLAAKSYQLGSDQYMYIGTPYFTTLRFHLPWFYRDGSSSTYGDTELVLGTVSTTTHTVTGGAECPCNLWVTHIEHAFEDSITAFSVNISLASATPFEIITNQSTTSDSSVKSYPLTTPFLLGKGVHYFIQLKSTGTKDNYIRLSGNQIAV